MIDRGEADAVIAGGTEAALTGLCIAAFRRMGALSREGVSRPFDAERDGFVMGEGAAVLVLEREEHARARGARILARVAGYGASNDAFHMTQPHETGRGAMQAMHATLANADAAPTDVGYINAHATSTPTGDVSEAKAIRLAFGDYADRLAVSATKSMIGHLFGAAGAVEGVATVLAIRDGILPPTINVKDPDVELDLVPNQARKAQVEVALSNGFGFGGHNAVVIFRRHEQ